MKLGIIGAMDVEIAEIREKMSKISSFSRAGTEFSEGLLCGLPVAVCKCGVGKVNAALCAQILCDCYHVTHIVNTGVAGSLTAELDIGDMVVSQDAMYHDFDCAFVGYLLGQVPGMQSLTFAADERLLGLAFYAAEQVHPGHTKVGRVASGDQFVCRDEQKAGIAAHTHALCTEMEGAAIAQTAVRNELPFVILRAISDKADGSAEMDYPTFEAQAAHRCAQVVLALAKALAEA